MNSYYQKEQGYHYFLLNYYLNGGDTVEMNIDKIVEKTLKKVLDSQAATFDDKIKAVLKKSTDDNGELNHEKLIANMSVFAFTESVGVSAKVTAESLKQVLQQLNK